MAVDIERLVLQMSADINKLEKANQRAVQGTSKSLKQIEDRFDQMNVRVSRSGEQMGLNLRNAIAGIGVTLAVRELEDYSNAWISLRNTARQYQDVIGPVGESTNRLVKTANDAGVAVQDLSFLMGAGSRAARTLGRDGDDVFNFLEAVSKGAAIANTGTAAVSGAMVQLSQSIGSPKAQLQEFNSIVEGTPRLAQAFADGIKEANGSISTLRQLIADGRVSGADLFQGLLSQLPKLRAEFATAEVSIGRALTVLRNAALQYVGAFDQSTGASATLAGLIKHVADNLDLFAAAAFATTVVLGGRGLAGAIGDVGKRLQETQRAFTGQREALAARAAAAKESSAAISVEAANIASNLAVQRKMVEQLGEAVAASEEASNSWHRQRAAMVEVENAQKALIAANNLAGESGGRLMSQQTAVALATHRLQEAEARLAILRQTQPQELKDYTRALAAMQAGEEAAAAASSKLVASQVELSAAQKAATGLTAEMSAVMKGFGAFLSGPLGTIALIGALTFGMQVFSGASKTTADRIDDVKSTMDRLRETQGFITTDTAKLKAENDKLTKAIEAQQPAAEDTARVEIAAIQSRIAKNKELAKTYESQIRSQLALAEQTARRENAGDKSVALGYALRPDVPIDASMPGGGADAILAAAKSAIVKAQTEGQALNDAQTRLITILARMEGRTADVERLRESLKDITNPTSADGASSVDVSGGASASKLKQYSTALEDYKNTLLAIGKSTEGVAAKSRAAVQALLDYAKASGDVAGALAHIPQLSDVLDPQDARLVRDELVGMAQAAVDAAATGADKIEADFRKAMENIATAHRAAVAAGIDDLAAYGRAIDDAVQKRADDLQDLADKMAVKSPFAGAIDDLKDDPKNLPEFEVYGQALRDATKEGLARGLKEGIETDDWGKAFRDVLADSITQALDKSLDRLADMLTNLVIGDGSSNNSGLINSFIGLFTSGQNRASGGPRSAFSMGKVNETGQGEFLFMGNNPGQVLTAAQVNAKVAGGARGSVSINAPLIVQGSIDAATWPQVQRAMAENNQKLMQVVPHMIDGRTIENRRYRRYGGKR
jgi:tape measure domain-containing protein